MSLRSEVTQWANIDPDAEEVGFSYGVRLSEGNGFNHYAENGEIWISEDSAEAEQKRVEVREKVKSGAECKTLPVSGYKNRNAMVFL